MQDVVTADLFTGIDLYENTADLIPSYLFCSASSDVIVIERNNIVWF